MVVGAKYLNVENIVRVLRSCTCLKELRSQHLQLLQTASDIPSDRFVNHVLIDMYAKCGSADDAESVFHGIASRNIYSWNFLLLAYTQTGHITKAKMVFEAMPQRNAVSCTTAMPFFSSTGNHHLSKVIFDGIPDRDLVLWNVLLNGHASNGHTLQAKETFDLMPEWSVVSWTTLITSFSQHLSSHNHARLLFDRAPERNSVLWNVVLGMYAQSGHILQSKAFFDQMPSHDLVAWNSMLAAYKESGDNDQTRSFFRFVPERNVMSWNTMITLDAMSFFSRMTMWSLASFTATVETLAARGDIEALREARAFFDTMPQRDALAWTCLISVYAHTGHTIAAKSTLERMPAWDVVSCTAMIQAHVMASGHRAAKEIFDSMPERNALTWSTLLHSAASDSIASCESIATKMPCYSPVSWSIHLAALSERGIIVEARKNSICPAKAIQYRGL